MLVLANGTHTALKTKLRLASTRRSDDLGDASTWQSSTKSSIERNQSCGQEAHPLLFGHDAFCYGTRLWADVGGHCTQEVVANCGVQPKQADELLPILVHEILQKKATINTRVGMNTEAPGMKVQNNSVQLRGTKPQGTHSNTSPRQRDTERGWQKSAGKTDLGASNVGALERLGAVLGKPHALEPAVCHGANCAPGAPAALQPTRTNWASRTEGSG